MISFKQFISEEKLSVSAVIRDCREILDVYKKSSNRLYHGTRSAESMLKRRWLERTEPRDTAGHVHDAINFNFIKTFGVAARNWRFASNSPGQTMPYGERYVLFPIGQASYLYSDQVFDAAGEYEWIKLNYKKQYPHLNYEERIKLVIKDIKARFADDFDYKFTDNAELPLNTQSNHEIMFKCNEYYLVQHSSKEMSEIEEYLREK